MIENREPLRALAVTFHTSAYMHSDISRGIVIMEALHGEIPRSSRDEMYLLRSKEIPGKLSDTKSIRFFSL